MSEATLPGQTTGDGWLFDDTVVHHIEIVLDDADKTSLELLPYEKVFADVVIDGIPVSDVGVRLRGKLGSFREVYEKPKWKFDFNLMDPERRFYGLESLSLNNSVADCSYLREKLAYTVYQEAGLVVPRMTWTTVSVNDEDYGLYQLVEHPDDRFLKRVMPNPDGNLYDGKYLWDGGWNITMLDFDENPELMVLEEGVDVGHADIFAVSDAIRAGTTGDWLTETSTVVDWDQMQTLIAGEQFVDQWDGYSLNQNNYRVWVNPSTGLIQLIPWDLDLAFPEWSWLTWDNPSGALTEGCFGDANCRAEYRLALEDLIVAVEAVDWNVPLDEWHELTIDAAAADPRKECDTSEVMDSRGDLANFMANRPAELRSEWGL